MPYAKTFRVVVLASALFSATCTSSNSPHTRPINHWPDETSTPDSITPLRIGESYSHLTIAGWTRLAESALPVHRGGFNTQSLKMRIEPDHCYLVMVFGGAGVLDADVAVVDGTDQLLAQDSHLTQDAEAHFCADHAMTAEIRAAASEGAGVLYVVGYEQPAPKTNREQQSPEAEAEEEQQSPEAEYRQQSPQDEYEYDTQSTTGRFWPVHKPDRVSQWRMSGEDLYVALLPSTYVVAAGPSLGSGVAVSAEHILTNCHVVADDPTTITVKNHNGEASAQLIQADGVHDRCVLLVENHALQPVRGVRPFSQLHIGETVYALGAPNGIGGTFSDGIISQVREVGGDHWIQTTAPISPGSSGGPLFDAYGNLIGITNGAIKDAQNLNFAIAADDWWK